ncbi:unnamed protein product, partial [Prorocentrum cordatum]
IPRSLLPVGHTPSRAQSRLPTKQGRATRRPRPRPQGGRASSARPRCHGCGQYLYPYPERRGLCGKRRRNAEAHWIRIKSSLLGPDVYPYPVRLRFLGKRAQESKTQWMWIQLLPATEPHAELRAARLARHARQDAGRRAPSRHAAHYKLTLGTRCAWCSEAGVSGQPGTKRGGGKAIIFKMPVEEEGEGEEDKRRRRRRRRRDRSKRGAAASHLCSGMAPRCATHGERPAMHQTRKPRNSEPASATAKEGRQETLLTAGLPLLKRLTAFFCEGCPLTCALPSPYTTLCSTDLHEEAG